MTKRPSCSSPSPPLAECQQPISQAHREARAEVARALGCATRLQMLELIQEGELSVGELTQRVGADQSTVSKHLAVLKHVGLVRMRRDGNRNLYRLACDCLQGFFQCLEAVLQQDLEQRQASTGESS